MVGAGGGIPAGTHRYAGRMSSAERPSEKRDKPAGRFRRMLDRLSSSQEELHSAELQQDAEAAGCTKIGECADRQIVKVTGTLRTVTLRPRAGVPALEAELFDGSDSLTLVWLGRREIAAITPGRSLEVQGRIGRHSGDRIIYNPRYTLLA